MSAAYRKKLIEVGLPLVAINAESAREKLIRHGHPSTLHLWWARRQLAACRAALLDWLVDAPIAIRNPPSHSAHRTAQEDTHLPAPFWLGSTALRCVPFQPPVRQWDCSKERRATQTVFVLHGLIRFLLTLNLLDLGKHPVEGRQKLFQVVRAGE
jgi:hypothetical protein